MTYYDPEAYGARCQDCYLRDKRDGDPVPPEMNPGSEIIIVGEAPGATEVEERAPFKGKSGWELSTGLAVHGVRRAQVSFTNALMCRAPPTSGGEEGLDLALHRLQKENKRREKENVKRKAEGYPDLPVLPSPFDCCRPRLLHDLAGYRNVLAVGKRGAEAVLGRNVSILELRGGPVTLDDGKLVMPTVHPAFVMRMRRWTKAFRGDIGRALRWFRGESSWRQPQIVFNAKPEQLAAFLTKIKAGAYDTETKSPIIGRPELAKDPLLAVLGLLGVASDDMVIVTAFLQVDGSPAGWTSWEREQLIRIFAQFFSDQSILKIDHNGYYDVPIIRRHIGVVPYPRIDNILQHRDVEPELPHGLGYVASVFTEIPYAWKIDHSGVDAESDDEWRTYNAIDCVLTYRATSSLSEGIELRKQGVPLAMHHAIQRYCIGLHQNGIWINRQKRDHWDVKLRAEAIDHLRSVKQAMRDAGLNEQYVRDFNPGSVEQLKDLFFDRWGFTPVEYSKKTGEPSTGDETIREFLRDPKLLIAQRVFLQKLRRFRATTKARGTYVRRMVSMHQIVPKDPLSVDETDDDETTRDDGLAHKLRSRKKKQLKSDTYGLVHDDGRAHGHWNSHSVVTGWRLSSNEPNFQNWMRKLREIAAPQNCPLDFMMANAGHWKFADGTPFRVYVYADQDQGEMRITAAFAGATRLLQAFKDKKDPHAINAEDFFGDTFVKANKSPREGENVADWDRLRDFSKTAFYALVYGAAFETAYETITSAEDANGNLPFVHYTQRQIRAIIDRWMVRNPEIVAWWDKEVDRFRTNSYLEDPLFGYRCDFLDGEDRNKILNFRAQSLLGAIVQKAAVQLCDGPNAPLAFGRYGHGTGLVNQGHDRLDFEWPVFHERRYATKDKKGNPMPQYGWCEKGCTCPLEIARLQITEAMRQRVPGLDVDFQGEAKVVVGGWV